MERFVMNIYKSRCPVCGSSLRWAKDGSLQVRCYSEGEVTVPGFFQLVRRCKNPLCEWSAIEGGDEW